jgi:hypothetical protein
VAVTTQNTGNNKIDAYLHVSTNDSIIFNPSSGYTTSVLAVTLTNEAPVTGLPPIVIDSPADPGLPSGANRSWLTIYSPLELRSAFLDGVPTTLSSGFEFGVNAFSDYVTVPSKSTVTLRVDLSGRLQPGNQLKIAVRLQPAANAQVVHVQVGSGGGSLLAGNNGEANLTFRDVLVQRRILNFASP